MDFILNWGDGSRCGVCAGCSCSAPRWSSSLVSFRKESVSFIKEKSSSRRLSIAACFSDELSQASSPPGFHSSKPARILLVEIIPLRSSSVKLLIGSLPTVCDGRKVKSWNGCSWDSITDRKLAIELLSSSTRLVLKLAIVSLVLLVGCVR